MKLRILLVFMISSVAFFSCTKYEANSGGSAATTACSSDMSGDNVFTGYILDYALEGKLVMSITEMGGTSVSGTNVTIKAYLNVNGQEYCCNSTGAAYLQKSYPEYLDGDYGAIATTPLICLSSNGMYGQFNINLGVDCGSNSLHKMYLKSDEKTISGCMTVDNPMAANRIIQITD